ncbi:hypothetical protein CEXT_87911 [Caerostris extrusa]|uniref:Uncharacterized protein n=1 Tax=Caerostris extrusa TaxID=172846 RepID=A0AAV4XS32_CAEEX|nr:hypothetical protein CEXT_87911 [Caerostris extrusa]
MLNEWGFSREFKMVGGPIDQVEEGEHERKENTRDDINALGREGNLFIHRLHRFTLGLSCALRTGASSRRADHRDGAPRASGRKNTLVC